MKFLVDDMEADKVCRLLEAADVNYISLEEDNVMETLNKRNCEKAADYLFEAFDWSESKEGGDYWNSVHDKLLDYVDMGGK